MSYVSIFLPTATGDFSAACCGLFEFGAGCLVLDPKGCTMDYHQVEDPRLPEVFPNVRSASMDDIDVTIGDCTKAAEIAQELVDEVNPPFLALIGSTVSSIIGLDTYMIAKDLENQLGLPVIPVDTDGFSSYAQGIHLSARAIVERFGEEGPQREKTVNVLGLTPLDFCDEKEAARICDAVERCGYTVNACLSMNTNLEQVQRAPQAQLNLAVSAAGLETARWMRQRYGIPYAAYCPMEADDQVLADALSAAASNQQPRNRKDEDGNSSEGSSLLIVHDAVIGASAKRWLLAHGFRGSINTATFFPTESGTFDALALKGDLSLIKHVQQEGYTHIAGDPLLFNISAFEELSKLAMPQPAFSSFMHRQSMPALAADATFLRELL